MCPLQTTRLATEWTDSCLVSCKDSCFKSSKLELANRMSRLKATPCFWRISVEIYALRCPYCSIMLSVQPFTVRRRPCLTTQLYTLTMALQILSVPVMVLIHAIFAKYLDGTTTRRVASSLNTVQMSSFPIE